MRSSLCTKSTGPICQAGVAMEYPTGLQGVLCIRAPIGCVRFCPPSNAATDQVDKFRVYAAAGVPFYWIADPERRILTVYRLERASYSVALQAKQGESVHPPPFDVMSLRVGLLFGDDPD
jgi:Putative restriction endonuclease